MYVCPKRCEDQRPAVVYVRRDGVEKREIKVGLDKIDDFVMKG